MSLPKYLGNKHTRVTVLSLAPSWEPFSTGRSVSALPRHGSVSSQQDGLTNRQQTAVLAVETPIAANPSGSCIPPLTSSVIQLQSSLTDNCYFLFGSGKLFQNSRTPNWLEVTGLRQASSKEQYKEARRKSANKLPLGCR